MGLTFSALHRITNEEGNEEVKTIELIPNGEEIFVDNENKMQYIDLLLDWTYCGAINTEIDIIRNTLNSIVPLDYLEMFTTGELECLISGRGEIDVKDWQNHTNYFKTFVSGSSETSIFFWQVFFPPTIFLSSSSSDFSANTTLHSGNIL